LLIIEANGRVVANYSIPAAAISFKQHINLPAGIYFFHLSGNKESVVQKIIVNSR
jgi:hypothetical protein